MSSRDRSFLSGLKFGAGAGVAFCFLAAFTVLLAQSITQFNSGDTVSSSQMNANFQMVAPEGLIAAFYLSACPSGWVAADGNNSTPDLRGRFLRALDDFGSGTGAAGIDPDGVRTLGAAQADAFQGHRHSHSMHTNYGSLSGPQGMLDSMSGTSSGTITIGDPINGSSGTIRVSTETRSTNVALLYCMRKDT